MADDGCRLEDHFARLGRPMRLAESCVLAKDVREGQRVLVSGELLDRVTDDSKKLMAEREQFGICFVPH